jgi:hypothetical protein
MFADLIILKKQCQINVVSLLKVRGRDLVAELPTAAFHVVVGYM